ncbi:MAG: MaoC/PaaZ C-terminal domain-containing protein [Anaerolineae bacterium]|nr:MaoC/PaaZ C-terminal domain-containing protein [Anaerolineae bacterium]
MTEAYQPRGLYFEDFEIGQKIVTQGRTITEADVVNFAGVSGDFNPMHTNAEYMKGHMFGQRVAHGLLVLSVASGLAYQLGIIDGTVLAFREIDEWKFSTPTLIGDTVRVELEVTELKPAARLGGGVVSLKARIFNQKDEVCQRGTWKMLIASRPAPA